MAEEHAWKVCIRQRIEGSNPSLTAIFKQKLQSCGFFYLRDNRHLPGLVMHRAVSGLLLPTAQHDRFLRACTHHPVPCFAKPASSPRSSQAGADGFALRARGLSLTAGSLRPQGLEC